MKCHLDSFKVYFFLFVKIFFCVVAGIDDETKTPCSDCGPNSVCINGVCQCQRKYIGSPPFCHIECLKSSDCEWSKMCINRRCVDACSETCGESALCNTVGHEPQCTCPPNTIGNPYFQCRPIGTIRKID